MFSNAMIFTADWALNKKIKRKQPLTICFEQHVKVDPVRTFDTLSPLPEAQNTVYESGL